MLESADQRLELEAERKLLDDERGRVAAERQRLDEQVAVQIASERSKLVASARREAADEFAVELSDRDHRMAELQERLKAAQDSELQLRKCERELQSKTEALQLEVARQLDGERDRIRAEARETSDREHQLREAEKQKQIDEMKLQIDDLKRKAEQGSQRLQGEVQEIALEDLLQTSFQTDSVLSVPKGVCGGDSLQKVLDGTGLDCGTILWESKRTKNWSPAWLSKLRDDQRAARAACAVIVSDALPERVSAFAWVDGVWVCSWSCVKPLATALRIGLMEVAKSRIAVQGQHGKMEMTYNYLVGQEFRSRVAGIAEALASMCTDLEAEKRSVQRLWSKRERQLERTITNAACMYGDLQGIIGSSLPAVAGLSTAKIECEEPAVATSGLLEISEI